MGAIHENEHNTAEAIKTDEKAANWSANKRSGSSANLRASVRRVCSLLLLLPAYVSSTSYESDNSTSNANALWIKVADLSAAAEDYKRAISVYVKIRKASLESSGAQVECEGLSLRSDAMKN
jgi:hypothetical protein